MIFKVFVFVYSKTTKLFRKAHLDSISYYYGYTLHLYSEVVQSELLGCLNFNLAGERLEA